MIYEISGRLGFVIIDILFTLVLVYSSFSLVNFLKSKEFQLNRVEFHSIGLLNLVIVSIFTIPIRIGFEIANVLTNSLLFYSINAAIFYGCFILALRSLLLELNESKSANFIQKFWRKAFQHKYEQRTKKEKICLFKSAKKTYLLLVLVYIFVLSIALSATKLFGISILKKVKLGFLWALIIMVICAIITIIFNKILPASKKITTEVLKHSISFAIILTYSIWAFQLTLLGIFGAFIGFYFIFNLQSYLLLIIIYFLVFIYAMKRIYFPQEIQKSEDKLAQFRGEKQKSEKDQYDVANTIQKPLLQVKDLVTYFFTQEGIVRAVEGVSFTIYPNEIVGLVGETGCGKSVTALSILKLVRAPGKIMAGQILFEGEDLLQKSPSEMLKYRGDKITMMFQDPMNSINPLFKVGDQIAEVYLLHKKYELISIVNKFKPKLDDVRNEIKSKRKLINSIEKQLKNLNSILFKYFIDLSKYKTKKSEIEQIDKKISQSLQDFDQRISAIQLNIKNYQNEFRYDEKIEEIEKKIQKSKDKMAKLNLKINSGLQIRKNRNLLEMEQNLIKNFKVEKQKFFLTKKQNKMEIKRLQDIKSNLNKEKAKSNKKLNQIHIKTTKIENKINEIHNGINHQKELHSSDKLNQIDTLYYNFQEAEAQILELNEKLNELKRYNSIFTLARYKSEKILREIGIPEPEHIYDRYPHELSGGMRQRIMIAMGLSCSPKLLLADEPTTALDVTIQKQILKLMKGMQEEYKTSILFITHDLGVISSLCNRVAVMYSGAIVEYGHVIDLFNNPFHPYSQGLISAIPKVENKVNQLPIIPGSVPNLIYPPEGCRFHPRCKSCFKPCTTIKPRTIEVKPKHFVKCHLFDPEYNHSQSHNQHKLQFKKNN